MEKWLGVVAMINLTVSDEKSLNQAISAKVNNLQVTDQAFEICKEALDNSATASNRLAVSNKQRTFDNLYKRMRLAMRGKNSKKRTELQNQITSQYMIKQVPNNNIYELIRDTLV